MPASRTLTINIDNYDDKKVQRILDAIAAAEGEPDLEDAIAGWTVGRAADLLHRLASGRSAIQAKVLAQAAAAGGTVSRAKVYELAGYAQGRSLKGFTRPVNRIVLKMKTTGVLPDSAVVPFAPIYDPNVASFQQAQGFRIPDELVALFAEAVAE